MVVLTEFALTLAVALLAAGVSTTLAPRLSNASTGPRWRFLQSEAAADKFALVFALAYVLVFGTLSILRHASLHSGGYDLGIFDQVIWNSLQGRPFENSLMVDSPSFLGHHFAPLLMAIVPLYAVWSDARLLLVLQTVALAVTALPLYWFARKRLGAGQACVVVAAFFLFPALQGVNLFEFHEIALATPLLGFALYFLLREHYLPFLVCLGLAMLAKEEVGFIAVAFGLYILFIQRRAKLGLVLAIFGAVWTVALLVYVIPYFYGTASGTGFYYAYRYAYLGKNVPEIILTAISQPGLVLEHLLVPDKIEFVLQLLVPLAFIPLVGAEVLALAVPSLGYLLIGDYPYQYSIRYQYGAPLVPIIFFALVIGLERLSRPRLLSLRNDPANFRSWFLYWRNRILARGAPPHHIDAMSSMGSGTLAASNTSLALTILLCVASLANYLFQSTGPFGAYFSPGDYTMTPHVQLGYRLLESIPANAAVIAETDLAPHISERRYIYEPSLVPDLRQIDYILADTKARQHAEEHAKVIWDVVLGLPYFETVAEEDGYVLKKRAGPLISNPLDIQFGDRIRLLGYTAGSDTPAPRGSTLPVILVWRADRSSLERYVVFVHLLDAQGRLWQQDNGEPGRGWFRTDHWKAGDMTNDGYSLSLPATMPPGDYRITVRLCSVENEQCLNAREGTGGALGSEPVVGTLQVGKDVSPVPIQPPAITHPLRRNMGDLELLGYTPEFSQAAPGDNLSVGLLWRAVRKPSMDLQVVLQLRDQAGIVSIEQAVSPADGTYPTTEWTAGEALLDWHDLILPATVAAGNYQVLLFLRDTRGGQVSPAVVLGSMKVAAISRQFTPPAITHPHIATFNNEIKLLGYDLAIEQGKIRLTLYWQALKPMESSYTVFTHLLDPQGRLVAQQDNLPLQSTRPTTSWLSGEILADAYTLALAPESTSGTFQIEVGLYEATNGERLTTSDGVDHLILTSVEMK